MASRVRLIEQLVGVEGLALLRRLGEASEAEVDRRLGELRALLADEELRAAEAAVELDPRAGYDAWAATYDEPGNPILALEDPAVRSLVDSVPRGRALDAACGTGRHARHLVELGHEVLGIDLSPMMLERAMAKVPEAAFLEADLRRVPAPDRHFDLVLCSLALGHVDDLAGAVEELARVLRPGGRLVASMLHPFQALLGWHARFTADGGRRFVRERPHLHGDYLTAFADAGLSVRRCVEPRLGADHVRALRRVFERAPEAALAAYVGTPALLIWALERR